MKNTLLSKNAFRSLFWCFALMLMMMPEKGWGQLYWGGTAAQSWIATTGTRWGSVEPTYSTNWTAGSAAVFNVPNSTITGATTSFSSIIANENVTVTPTGTLGTGGTVASITVASGKILNFGGQGFSTAIGTGFIKEGSGTMISSNGNTYSGGFTLNAGTMQVGGTNSMGAGGTLVINGGVLTANSASARNFTGKFTGGITIGGNFQFGDAINVPIGTGPLTFSNLVTLGATTRTITIGGIGIYTIGGIISGSSSAGLTVNSTAAGILLFTNINTYPGTTTLTGGELRLNPSNTLALTGACTFNGGELATTNITATRAITFSSINLSDNSTLALGANAHTVTFTNSDTFTSSKTLTVTGWTGVYNGTSGTAGKIFVGSTAAGLSTAQLRQIVFFNGTTNFPATILATGEVVPFTDTTWNGTTWSNGDPSAIVEAVIDGPYSTGLNGTISAKKLTVTSAGSLTISSNTNVTIQNELINNAGVVAVVVENNANLIQVNPIANTGNITVKRNSSSLMRQDYTLWSSPVAGQQLQAFSPATLAARFYTYNTTSNLYAVETATNNFTTGAGYLIRMPNDHPATATIWNGTFAGIPNNGNAGFTMIDNGAGFRFNLVGNPYPSPIDMAGFVAANSANITGTLYFWRKTNNAASPSYCSWTAGTFTTNGEAEVFDPNNIIRTGQGFFVEGSGAGTAITFNNTMRNGDIANQFFRTNNAPTLSEKSRIWLNANNAAGAFSQMALVYVDGAVSNGADMYDGRYINDGEIALNSTVNAVDYVIQGRAPFTVSDVVPLNFKATAAGTYTIAIDHVDGLFTGGQAIYLKDNLTNSTHNLSTSSYAFATAAGVFNTRFEIVYQNLLSVDLPTFNENSVVVYKNNGSININTGTTTMDNVKIFDISGRLLIEKLNVNTTEMTIDSSKFASQVLVVQITSDTQIKVSKKVVN